MERFREEKIYSNKITQSGLEGMLFTTDGELLEIRELGPKDEKGIPEGYRLLFDLQRQRPLYDVVSVNPETDPFGSLEESIRLSHKNLDTFVGTIETTWCGMHERYLVFKKKAPGGSGHFSSGSGFLSLLLMLGVSFCLLHYFSEKQSGKNVAYASQTIRAIRSFNIMISTIQGFYFGARVVENAVGLVFRKKEK